MPSESTVSRAEIVLRGLTNRCPNCGRRTLFKKGSPFQVNKECPACSFKIERDNDEGFYLGSLSLNFGVTLVGYLLPVGLLAYFGVIGTATAEVLAGCAVIVPILLYRPSRSWWLMNYYIFFPQHLPANGGKGRSGE